MGWAVGLTHCFPRDLSLLVFAPGFYKQPSQVGEIGLVGVSVFRCGISFWGRGIDAYHGMCGMGGVGS